MRKEIIRLNISVVIADMAASILIYVRYMWICVFPGSLVVAWSGSGHNTCINICSGYMFSRLAVRVR